MFISLSLGVVMYMPITYVGLRDTSITLNGYMNSSRVEVGDRLSDQVGKRFMHPV